MDRDENDRRAQDAEAMLRHYTDPDAFRRDNEMLDEVIFAFRRKYDQSIDTIRPALEELTERPQAF